MSIFDGIGGAVSSLFGAMGDQKQAGGYKAQAAGYRKAAGSSLVAAHLADQEGALSERSTAITLQQQQRSAYGIISGQQADTSGAGFGQSGSALDLLRSSRQQAALSNQLLSAQGQITATGFAAEGNSYRAQSDSYLAQAAGSDAQASASNTKASGGFLNTALSVVGVGLSLFSDRRLKKNVELYDTYAGMNLYTFNYLWEEDDAPKNVGLMAQEIREQYPTAVFENDEGYLSINLDELNKLVN